MNVTADNLTSVCPPAPEDAALERRILRGMCAAVALAAASSAALAPWRVTTGLLLGGALSLFNHHWLRTSIAAALRVTQSQPRPRRMKLARYVLRYFVVACVVTAAVALNVVSLAATLAGMCSFVAALFVEAGSQFYRAIVNREET
ncbi:MAG TPA: ATP synthase subunit I [Pyrinomonadaceae bacterium]|jgi:hypothetical protein|nr:ATP synthase subunit I [Pyrinomonadaceae bacterium]